MSIVRVQPDEIDVGTALPWAVYDAHNRLLLQKGEVIHNRHQMRVLLERGMYRGAEELPEAHNEAPIPATPRVEAYEILDELTRRLSNVFTGLIDRRPATQRHLASLCIDLERLCLADADTALAAVHTYRHPRYSLIHPLHVAVLSYFVAARRGYNPERIRAIIGAALTGNVGMVEIQDELQRQEDPLSEEQRQLVREHPERSVELLAQAGVENAVWLDTVLHHHERTDGSGYPHGGQHQAVPEEAMVVALADRYAAMISGRDYRAALPGPQALRALFLDRGKEFPERLCLNFIKELGIFPPGTLVRLINGEVGVVVKRGTGRRWRPIVHSLRDRHGHAYVMPQPRDTNDPKFAIDALYGDGPPLRFDFASLWKPD